MFVNPGLPTWVAETLACLFWIIVVIGPLFRASVVGHVWNARGVYIPHFL